MNQIIKGFVIATVIAVVSTLLVACGEDEPGLTYDIRTENITQAEIEVAVQAILPYYDNINVNDLKIIVIGDWYLIGDDLCKPTTLTLGVIMGCWEHSDRSVRMFWNLSPETTAELKLYGVQLTKILLLQTLAHELGHAWLQDTTKDSDSNHMHSEVFGTDDGQYGGSPEVDSIVELAADVALQAMKN